jgi:hypothetical protein
METSHSAFLIAQINCLHNSLLGLFKEFGEGEGLYGYRIMDGKRNFVSYA